MQVNIVNVDIEVGKPGPKGWSKAVVDYDLNGQRRKQNIMSFTNPQVYREVTSGKYTGETVEVSLTKNAKGYDEWAAISLSGNSGGQTSSTSASSAPVVGNAGGTTSRVVGSNYETAVERARRQVLIVKQSSLTAALKLLELNGEKATGMDTVKELAQEFADWVMEEPELDDGPTD